MHRFIENVNLNPAESLGQRSSTTFLGQWPPYKETPHLLLVTSSAALGDSLCDNLEEAGYLVTQVMSGEKALEKIHDSTMDLVIVSRNIVDIDALHLCAELRRRSRIPIVMFSETKQIDDLTQVLALGADDYISKPLTFREVEVRLIAILRRSRRRPEPLIMPVFADFVLDEHLARVIVRGKLIHLTPIEYRLLYYIMGAWERPISKQELCRIVWGYQSLEAVNFIEVAVRRLREKIENDPSNPEFLITIRGAGYQFSREHLSGLS